MAQISENEHLRILLVEDDFSMRRLIRSFVSSTWPCQIYEAEDGLAALAMLLKSRTKFDLIVLDMLLPFADGLDVLKIIRGKPQFQTLPVVACTSVTDSQKVKEILKHGIQGYVIKPIDKQTLLQKIFQALKKRRRYIFPPVVDALP